MNLPNKLTLLRIILIPFFMFFYLATFISFGKLIAIGIFIIAAITDFLDGKIARSRNLVTNLGKFLDPIADKLLVFSALIMLVCTNGLIFEPYGLIILFIILARDLIVDVLRQIASTKNCVIAADIYGKIKTFVMDITLPMYILYAYFFVNSISSSFITIYGYICFGLLLVCCLLTIFSGLNYVIKNKSVFLD